MAIGSGSGRGLEILRLGTFGRLLLLGGLVLCLALAVGLSRARGRGGGRCLRLLGLWLGLLLADEACQVRGGLGGLVDAGLGFGGGLAQDGAQDAAEGVGVCADETLGIDGVVAELDQLLVVSAHAVSYISVMDAWA